MFRNWNLFFFEDQFVCASPGFAELMLFFWVSPSFPVCAAMPPHLCHVASWAVVQSDVQPSKSFPQSSRCNISKHEDPLSPRDSVPRWGSVQNEIRPFPFPLYQQKWSAQSQCHAFRNLKTEGLRKFGQLWYYVLPNFNSQTTKQKNQPRMQASRIAGEMLQAQASLDHRYSICRQAASSSCALHLWTAC